MYLKRKVYDQLLDWKNDTVHSTLEVNGARQVGKTYIINKFADENFRHKIYINLFDLSGKQFMECYKKATDWTPGTKRPEQPLHDAFKLFDPDFEDTNDTVIIIDEIQESSEIFNRIREFTRYFHPQVPAGRAGNQGHALPHRHGGAGTAGWGGFHPAGVLSGAGGGAQDPDTCPAHGVPVPAVL